MSKKSKPVYITIDSMPRPYVSKGHKRGVSLHKAQQWCLSGKDKKLVNFMKENLVPKVIKRRISK